MPLKCLFFEEKKVNIIQNLKQPWQIDDFQHLLSNWFITVLGCKLQAHQATFAQHLRRWTEWSSVTSTFENSRNDDVNDDDDWTITMNCLLLQAHWQWWSWRYWGRWRWWRWPIISTIWPLDGWLSILRSRLHQFENKCLSHKNDRTGMRNKQKKGGNVLRFSLTWDRWSWVQGG